MFRYIPSFRNPAASYLAPAEWDHTSLRAQYHCNVASAPTEIGGTPALQVVNMTHMTHICFKIVMTGCNMIQYSVLSDDI